MALKPTVLRKRQFEEFVDEGDFVYESALARQKIGNTESRLIIKDFTELLKRLQNCCDNILDLILKLAKLE